LADEFWSRYLAQSINISFATRPIVRRGEDIPCRFTVRTQRFARNLQCKVDWEASTLEIDGQPIPPASRRNTLQLTSSSDEEQTMSSTRHAISLGERWATLKDGPHHVVAILRWTLWSPGGRDAASVFSGETRFDSSLQVVPQTRDTITISADPEVGAAMKKGISIHIAGDQDLVVVRVEGHGLPAGLGAHPFLRAGDTDARGNGQVDVAPGDGIPAIFAGHVAPDLQRVDVVFRPDLDVARRSVEVIEAWGEELVFKDVPIHRSQHRMNRTPHPSMSQPPPITPQGW
jgi:hypothetical protein